MPKFQSIVYLLKELKSSLVIGYVSRHRRHAPANRAGRVQNRPVGGWNLLQNAKKMFFIWNELNDLLQIKELAVFGLKNELYFERQKHKTNSRIWQKTGPGRHSPGPSVMQRKRTSSTEK